MNRPGDEGWRLARRLGGLLVCLAVGLPSRLALADIPLVDSDTARFTLGGYAKSLAGYQHLPYDTAGLFPDESGVGTQVIRLEWGLSVGDWMALEVANRLFWQLTPGSSSLGGSVLGLGVSAPPEHSVDLSTDLLQSDDFRLEHDLDRLAWHLFFDAADVTLGRPAISWGNALLFPVADLWTQFSPFELDTSEKRGVDAVRVLTSPTQRLELDFIVADKGSLEDLSGGLRANLFLEVADVYIAAAKIWNEVFLFAGLHADLKTVSLRLDGALPYHLDDEALQLPRLTLGLDYLATDLTLSVELHFNGAGAEGSDEYFDTLTSEPLARGEVYLLGRYYVGALVAYNLTELLVLDLSVLSNLADPSAVLAPSFLYQVSENADLSLGAYVGLGEEPTIALPPRIGSEFGLYGQFYYAQMAAYF